MKAVDLFAGAWRWSWVLTAPVVLAFGWWLQTTWHRYDSFKVEQAALEDFGLRRVGAMTAGELLRRLEVDWTQTGTGRPLPGLRTLELFVAEADLRRLDADLPHSGFTFVDGMLRWRGDDWKVSVRYRGDNVYHWGYRKKSFRIKTDKDRLFEGMRAFNLIAPRTPELLNNFLAYRLAARLQLVAPRVELVEVRLNGAVLGVEVLTEQLDESTLRSQSYMPGDLYSGDAVAQRAWTGIRNDLFRYPALWEKQAENNHYPAGARAPLEALLAVVGAPPIEARHQRLHELVDLEAFAAFSALEILCATIHVDTEHNWRLFYDANRCRFVPVVWDLFGWDARFAPEPGAGPRLDVLASPLHAVLHADARFLAARQAVLARFFAGGTHAAFLAEVDRAIAAVTPAVARDPALTMQVQTFRPAEVRAAMASLRERIERLWRDVDRASCEPQRPIGYWHDGDVVGLVVDDRVPLTLVQLQLDREVRPAAASVRFWRDGAPHDVDVSAAVAAHGTRLEVEVALLARHVQQIESLRTFEVKANRMVIRPASYELRIDGLEAARVFDVRCGRGPKWTESAVPVSPCQLDLGPMFAVVEPRPVQRPLVWSGRVELLGVTTLDVPLLIEPGSTIVLSPAASVVARARVLARGRPDAPIRFEPRGDQPWGAFALQGRGTDGSRFAHCEFRGGSGYKTPLFEYSAMLSVHDAHDVQLAHCQVRDGRIVDDMLHAVYAELQVEDCAFVGALADAVDLDISRASFDRCRFERNGNDGLDLMTSAVRVTDCSFRGCGDKGISVGEGSRVLALRPAMVGCGFGVQVKDGSVAALIAAELTGNRGAVDAYLKNWRYGAGGRVFVYNSRLGGNQTAATADRRSHVLLRDCAVEPPATTSASVRIEGTASAGPVRRDPADLEALRDLVPGRD